MDVLYRTGVVCQHCY